MSTARTDPILFAAWAQLMVQHTHAILARRTSDDRPVWVEDLQTRSGNIYRILITDDRPPKASVLRPTLVSSPHQFLGGGLCLEHSYRPTLSPLTARTRALAWLETYEAWRRTGRWPEEPHQALSEPPTERK